MSTRRMMVVGAHSADFVWRAAGAVACHTAAGGAVGVLVDASVRDVADLRAIGLPVWTRWRRVRGATKSVRGSVDVPVRVGGTEIAPQDVVVLDDDGAAAVPLCRVESTVAAVRERVAKEDGLRERWGSGELSYDAYGLRAEDEVSDQVGT